jgi:hypothetical protein
VEEQVMHTHRFGKKISLPSTIAIKHQLRKLMFEDLIEEAKEAALRCSDSSVFGGKQEVAAQKRGVVHEPIAEVAVAGVGPKAGVPQF